MKALINCDIFDGQQILTNHAILIKNQYIEDVVKEDVVPEEYQRINLKGYSVCPGFIDMQVNGGGGRLLNDQADEASIKAVLNAHKAYGTTSIFPTVFTMHFDRMKQLLDSSIILKNQGVQGIAGLHFEGPIINEKKAGIHLKTNIRKAETQLIDFYKASAREFPTLVTLAPEMVDPSFIRELRNAGVLVFAGHTNASYEQMIEAMNDGLQGVTHLYNASSGPGSREPGVVGAALEQDKAFFSIIVDGYHVHWASVRIAWKCKPKGKVFLVTDAMPAVGFDGKSFKIGDLEVFIGEGCCQTADGTLAGSALDLATAIRNCIQKVGIPRPEAIRMATLYPAKFAGIEQSVGTITPGKRADLVITDNEMHVQQVFQGGQEVISNPS